MILFGISLILFPELLSYMLWFLFIFIWFNIVLWLYLMKKKMKSHNEKMFELFWYKVYKWK